MVHLIEKNIEKSDIFLHYPYTSIFLKVIEVILRGVCSAFNFITQIKIRGLVQ